jgi:uncharacterized protein YndB with AHSA1/START domain
LNGFTIEKEIELKAPIEKVFSSLTNSEEIPKFFPIDSVESTWVVGGEVLYKGNVSGDHFTDYGIIEKLSVPHIYQYRYWSDNHGTQRTDENHLTIAYRLEKLPEGTRLSVRQGNIKSPQMYELMSTQVWDFLLDSFKQYIEASA